MIPRALTCLLGTSFRPQIPRESFGEVRVGIRTRRWNDPPRPGDGTRILVSRYRPRALPRSEETWDEWRKELGPSRDLHAAVYGKLGPVPSWDDYKATYLDEMRGQTERLDTLAERVRAGEALTFLCSRACRDPRRCHRLLLKHLVEARLPESLRSPDEPPPADAPGSPLWPPG